MKSTIIRTYGKVDVDGSRFLLGDHLGNLFVLILHQVDNTVIDLKLEQLGEVT